MVALLLVVVVSCGLLRVVRPAQRGVEAESLQLGDIIFVDLYDDWCHTGYWDHMAIYVGQQPSVSIYPGLGVVESTFDTGVCFTPLGTFLERDKPARMSVQRLKDIPGRSEFVRRAIDYATAQIGKPFDLTAVLGVPLKINEGNLHCVEIVWAAFKAGGLNLDANAGLLLYPDDIYYSPKLEPS